MKKARAEVKIPDFEFLNDNDIEFEEGTVLIVENVKDLLPSMIDRRRLIRVQSIRILNDDDYFSSEDGNMVFSRKTKRLLFCLEREGDIVIPNGVEVIAEGVFQNSDIRSVFMPDSVRVVESSAFAGCQKLKNVHFSQSLRRIGNFSFSRTDIRSAELPDSLIDIGDGAFSGCLSLKDVRFPSKLKRIGMRAFFRTDIRLAELPDSLTKIEFGAFERCTGLENVRIPKNIKIIGYRAFSWTKVNPEELHLQTEI